MLIAAIQKNSLIDFPGKISAVIFTGGCNFHCPYCHNPSLITADKANGISELELLSFLKKRQGLLEGIVISGGEPCIQTGLIEFCLTIKRMGFAVKLDTNGSQPRVLQQLLDRELLDYIAMDLKTDPAEYPASLCTNYSADNTTQSMRLIAQSGLGHEFRTTCAAPFINRQSITKIAQAIVCHASPQSPLFLQQANLEQILNPQFFVAIKSLSNTEIQQLQKTALAYLNTCIIR